MKAWMLKALHSDLERVEVPVPEPGPGQVLVSVRAAGLCHSDVGVIEGVLPLSHALPIILGHESAGEVVALGQGVTGFQPGDRVAPAGDIANAPGISRDGAYSEYVVLDADRTVPLPKGLDWDQAAAATDAGVTSYMGVVVAGGLRPGMRVCVIGLGGLGLVGARIAVLKGAEVHAVEPKTDIWPTAREMGINQIVPDIAQYAGSDFDLVVDYAGFGTTTTGAMQAVRRGGRIVLVGLGAPEFTVSSATLVLRSLEIVGTTPSGDPEVLRDVFELLASGELHIATTAIDFDRIPEGLELLAKGQVHGRLVALMP